MRTRFARTATDNAVILLIAAFIVGVVAVLVVSCIDTPSEGTVIGKRYHPAYTTTTWNYMSRDSKGNCSLNMPQPQYHPESWELCLRNVKEDKEGCRSVDQIDYHKYEIGQWYP